MPNFDAIPGTAPETERGSAARRELRHAEVALEESIYDIAILSHLGNGRENNEDYVGYSLEAQESLVMAIADGVGGLEGGELASQIAVEATIASFTEQQSNVPPEKRLYRAAQQANIEIYDKAIVVTELKDMSTTLTAIALDGGMLHAAHVGDTRLYLIRGERIRLLTKDHTLEHEHRAKKANGDITGTGVLTRSLGRELIAAVDRLSLPLYSGDTLLLCTDGVYGVLKDADLLALATAGDARTASQALVDAALERKTRDNLSVGVCRVVGPVETQAQEETWMTKLRSWLRSND